MTLYLASNDFLDMTSKAQATKTKTDKWDYIKLKNSCSSKDIINRVKGNLRMGENTCKIRI